MDKKQLLTTNFTLFQLFVLLLLSYNYVFTTFRINHSLVAAIVVASSVFNLWTIKELNRLSLVERQAVLNNEKSEQAQKLIITLRSKHHDFINHLQVVMGLIQIKKPNEAVEYIKDLSKDLVEIEKLITLKKPEVAALISSKLSGLSYVETELEILTNLKDLKIQSDKLISLLGNLLDNAIFETSLKTDKWIKVKIYEEDNWFIFEITNPGKIPEGLEKKIFEPGVTTKGEKGTGMGLYIVKDTVTKIGGQIALDVATEGRITFILKLPR